MSTSVEKSTFSFVKYLITDAKINVSDKEISKKINFSFTPSGIIDKENKRFELKLQTEVSDKNKSFKIKLCAIGLFKNEGHIYIWVTDDENKIPVKVSTKIVIGDVYAELTKFSGLLNKATAKIG